MATEVELPPALQYLAKLLDQQPPEVRVLFRYCLILALMDDEKARVIGMRRENEQEWLTIETVAIDVFEIVRPPISEEVEAQLMRQVRAIIANEDDVGS